MFIHAPDPNEVRGLPMAIRIALRDTWGKEDGELSRAMTQLETDMGVAPTLFLDWNTMWEKLSNAFKTDAALFVPRVSEAAVDLVRTVLATAESDEDWGDRLLTELQKASKKTLEMSLVVDGSKSSPELVWHETRATLTLLLPTEPENRHIYYQPGKLGTKMRNIFEPTPDTTAGSPTAASTPAAPLAASQAPRVVPAIVPGSASIGMRPLATASSTVPETMPKLNTIPSPARLSDVAVPYYMWMWERKIDRRENVEVYCTHESSLDLFVDYAEKWVQPNAQSTDKAKCFRFENLNSAFGPGRTGVRIDRRFNFGPVPDAVIVLQFFQGVLGYRVVQTKELYWCLARETPFA